MIGLAYCFIGLFLAYLGARRSLGRGLFVVFLWGYVYGVVRARYLDGITHFGFDASLAGLYLGHFTKAGLGTEFEVRSRAARTWAMVLIGWPAIVMAYSPLLESQPMVIQIVGLRAMVMFVPMIVVGARLTREDLDYLAPRVAMLNLLALALAGYEYVEGIEAVMPKNASTEIIYQSQDIVANGTTYSRIPGPFLHAHIYGFSMIASIPFVAHGLESERRSRTLCMVGLGAAAIGILMCGARLPAGVVMIALIYVLASLKVKPSTWFAFVVLLALGAAAAMTEERLQRFESLTDTNMVEGRIRASVNVSFFDVVYQFPFGSGLARAWGTAIPFFLQNMALPQIGIENEFARITIDTGIPGLLLWISFFVWVIAQRSDHSEAAPVMKMFSWPLTSLTILSSAMGVGFFTAVPVTAFLMLLIGMRCTRPLVVTQAREIRLVGRRPVPFRTPPSPERARGELVS